MVYLFELKIYVYLTLVSGKQLINAYIALIYLSQKYTNVPCTIIKNCNVFVFFEQNTRTIKDFIFREVCDQFEK